MFIADITWKEYRKLTPNEKFMYKIYLLHKEQAGEIADCHDELLKLITGYSHIQYKAVKGSQTEYFCSGEEIKNFFNRQDLKRYVGKNINGWEISKADGARYYNKYSYEVLLEDINYIEMGFPED